MQPLSFQTFTCPDDETWQQWLAAALHGEAKRNFAAHINQCRACEQVFAALAAPQNASQREQKAQLATIGKERYILQAVVAVGGMGSICNGRDRELQREVAIKMPREDAVSQTRFATEIAVLAQLEHPAIVALLDAGTFGDGAPFLVMPLLRGETLDAQLSKPRNLEARLQLVQTVMPVIDAVAYAHAQGVLHRDIKPHNIYITTHGTAVLLDWGLAQWRTQSQLAAEGDLAAGSGPNGPLPPSGMHTHSAVGTPLYAAPEQRLGAAVDERTDVYGLGGILFAVLTGQPPNHPPAGGLPAALADAPRDLAAIVLRALAVEPDKRYASARELAKDLERFSLGLLVGARQYSWLARTRNWLARHRVAAVATAVALSASLVSAIVWSQAVRRQRDRAMVAQRLAEESAARRSATVETLFANVRVDYEALGRIDLLAQLAEKIAPLVTNLPATSAATAAYEQAQLALLQIDVALVQQEWRQAKSVHAAALPTLLRVPVAQRAKVWCAYAQAGWQIAKRDVHDAAFPLLASCLGPRWLVESPAASERSNTLALLGAHAYQQGELPAAIAYYQKALHGVAEQSRRFNYYVIGTRLARLLFEASKLAESTALRVQLAETLAAARRGAPENRELALSEVMLLLVNAQLANAEKAADADEQAAKAVRAARTYVDSDSQNREAKVLLQNALSLQAERLPAQRAVVLYEELVELRRQTVFLSPTANALGNLRAELSGLAEIYLELGRSDAALATCVENLNVVVRMQQMPTGCPSAHEINTRLVCAQAYHAAGQLRGAVEMIEMGLHRFADAPANDTLEAMLQLQGLLLLAEWAPRRVTASRLDGAIATAQRVGTGQPAVETVIAEAQQVRARLR